MSMHRLIIPGAFWYDHADRCPYDNENDAPQAIEHRGSRVLIEATDEGLRGLRADAEYYADADSMDECPRHVRRSARLTVAALDAYDTARGAA